MDDNTEALRDDDYMLVPTDAAEKEALTSKKAQKTEKILLTEILPSSNRPTNDVSSPGNEDAITLNAMPIVGDVEETEIQLQKHVPVIANEQQSVKDCDDRSSQHDDLCGSRVEMEDLCIRDARGRTAIHRLVNARLNGLADQDCPSIQLKPLLDEGARIVIKDNYGCLPLHYAAVSGYVECAKLLIENNPASKNMLSFSGVEKGESEFQELDMPSVNEQLNMKDDDGRTPLHYAAEYQHVDMCKLLVDKEADFNGRDNGGKTPLHLLLTNICYDRSVEKPLVIRLFKYLLDKGARVDIKDKFDHTPLYYAARGGYVACTKLIIEALVEPTRVDGTVGEGSSLVIQQLNIKDNFGSTALHYAAKYKHVELCELLVKNGIDVNVRNKNGRTALHRLVDRVDGCAVQNAPNGELVRNMLEVMLEAGAHIDMPDTKGNTPLHLACGAGNIDLVGVLLQFKADVTRLSEDGRNALDFAIISGNTSCVRTILETEKWREALRNSSRYNVHDDGLIDTPMRELIRKMPEIAEEVLTKCMVKGEQPVHDISYQVLFLYEFLDDEFCSQTCINSDEFDNSALPYSDDLNLLKKNHPLNIMVKEKRESLLRHPVVVSLVCYKWNRFVGPVYSLNVLLYLIFMGFFNSYMLTMPPPFSIDSNNVTSSCVAISSEAQSSFGPCYDYNSWGIIAKYFIIVLSALSILKELYQVYLQRIAYLLSLTNLLEVSLYVLAILTVYSDTSQMGPSYVGVREAWQWQIGAVAIFLSWMVLIMFIQNVPTFGIYVLMFNHVLRTFLKFLFVFGLFIFGFAFSFYCLLQNQHAFRDLGNAVIKTTLMMIGEFQFEDIFVAEFVAIETGADNHTIAASTVNYRAVSYIFFTIFIIVMSIIIMNLLVGLAVDDIKGVQNNAYLESLAMQVKLTLDIHYTLPKFIRRRFILKFQRFFPNRYRRTSTFLQWLHSVVSLNLATINEALDSETNDPNKLEKQVESLDQEVKGLDRKLQCLEDKIAVLDNRSSSMENMMSAMMSHFQINETKITSTVKNL